MSILFAGDLLDKMIYGDRDDKIAAWGAIGTLVLIMGALVAAWLLQG